jgi:hypothetical protein
LGKDFAFGNWIFNVCDLFTTGQYMDRNFNHLADMEDLPRVLMRAQHLYILFSALINIALGCYLNISKDVWIKTFQLLGSLLIEIATIILLYSFFKELPSNQIESPLCRQGVYIMLAGVLGHGIPSILQLIIKKP